MKGLWLMQKHIVLFTFVLGACAVSQETEPAKVSLDSTIAKSQASALTTAVESAQADDGLAIAEAVANVGDRAAALVPQTKDGGRLRLKKSATTCTCDASTRRCSFDACTIGNATVSGTLTWTTGTITCTGLAFDIAATSSAIAQAHVEVDCAITYGAGQLSGNLHTTGNAVVNDTTYTWDATLAANAVTFDKTAFTGGSVDVSATVMTSSKTAEAKTFDAAAVVTLP